VDAAVVICAAALDVVADRPALLAGLAGLRERAAALLITAPTGFDHDGFVALLTDAGLAPAFVGRTRSTANATKDTWVALVEGAGTPPLSAPPSDFRVLAVVIGHNEWDILPHTLRRLVAEGIEVVYVDNWSTDGSFEAVTATFGDTVRVVRHPATRTAQMSWRDLLEHTEQVGRASGADWVVHHDADEVREGPWADLSLRDALWNVQQRGFTAVNFRVLVFRPTTAVEPAPGSDPAVNLIWWDHLRRPSNLMQVKAWRNSGQPVALAGTAGHAAEFPGRRIFPYDFLLRHYPLRSPAHARRKVFGERRERWSAAERASGWHTHYDHLTEADEFVWDPATLHRWDPAEFALDQLTERLAGVGVEARPDPARAPALADPPDPARAQLIQVNRDRAELRAALAACRERAAVQRRRLGRARRRLGEAEAAIVDLTGSRSWRLTAPIRRGSHLLRRVRRRLAALR
jgi:Glycosyl transferase family 2